MATKSLSSWELEGHKYQEVKTADAEVDRILQEIDNVFSNTPDGAEAERIIMEKYAPLMDEAMEQSGEALRKWLSSMIAALEETISVVGDSPTDER